MSDPSLYTVGWICALDTENTAARQFLDEEHDRPSHVFANDNNGYTLGKMADHNVVIAILPAGEYGLISAATVANDMLSTFPNIRLGMMVGIGGGAPTTEHDIRLGDVVVSCPSDGRGGVYQYDHGKNIQGQSFQPTGFLNQPSALARTTVNNLRSRYEEGHQIKERIQAVLDRKPILRTKYGRPNQESDLLYKPNIIHPFDVPGSCRKLCGVKVSDIIQRRDRGEHETNPTIHYGNIASANQLMKDATTRNILATKHGILCFEMEAAGLMNLFPFLVVRGICDYSDSHKNKEWQGFAAMTAAAYARDVLNLMVPSRVGNEKKLAEAVNSMSRKVDAIGTITRKLEVNLGDFRVQEHKSRMIDWLSSPDPSTNYNKALEQRQEGTGLWLIHGDAFKQWKQHSNSLLWLRGILGCGKTVLSSTIIEHLKQDSTCQVLLYFYFDFGDSGKRSLNDLLCSLIRQLYEYQFDLRVYLDQLWTSHGEGTQRPSTRSLQDVLKVMLGRIGNVYIVLDALDESNTRDDLLAWLETLVRCKFTGNRLLVTARGEEEIDAAFQRHTRSWDRIEIQQHDIDTDIRAYVHDQVHNGTCLGRWRSRPDMQLEIVTGLTKNANGMFRQVACQIEALRTCYDPQQLLKALTELPEDLNGTYRRILGDIPHKSLGKAMTILNLLIWSERPLRLEEMADAVVVQPSQSPGFSLQNRMPEPRDLLTICSSLVSAVKRLRNDNDDHYIGLDGRSNDHEEKVIELRLAHFSVKQCLESQVIIRSFAGLARTTARASIAIICLTYLSGLDHTLSLSEIRKRFAFSQYCARYWMDHARAADRTNEELQAYISRFFEDKETAYLTCYNLHNPMEPRKTNEHRSDADIAEPIFYASLGGLTVTVKRMIDNGADLNALGGAYGNALQAASYRGRSKTVQILLDGGADINAQGGAYGNALQAASYGGHVKTVQVLLDKGADINAQGRAYGNALQAASYGGHVKTVQVLLDKGADINAQGGAYGNALQAASYKGHAKTTQILLDRGAYVNAQGGTYGNALQAATYGGHAKTMQVLLDKGVAIDA